MSYGDFASREDFPGGRFFHEDTGDGKFVFDCYGPSLKVEAVRDEADGDWKTAMARGYTGIKKGEFAVLHKVWGNLYGRWARIEMNGRQFDVRLSALKLHECHIQDEFGYPSKRSYP